MATLSPGRMRMKFFRIFPEMWARTLCPFSSSARNIALGRASKTVAVTSIASSLAIICLQARQDVGPIPRDGNHVFKVRRGLAVLSHRRPIIV